MSLIEKRSRYQRSLTLSSIPFNHAVETRPSTCSRNSLEQPASSTQVSSGLEAVAENGQTVSKSPKWGSEIRRSTEQPGSLLTTTKSSTRCRNRTKSKSLARKISCNEFSQSSSLISGKKSSSGSSNIFNKVKDKIVETVYQTQDMPHWAAIVQERRQKAADQCEAKIVLTLNKELLKISSTNSIEETHKDKPSGTAAEDTSFPSHREKSIIGKREKARQGFRRRSISQDSYPQSLLLPKACPLVAKKSSDGITCSSGDFQAILQGFNSYMKQTKGPSSTSSASSMLSKQEDNSNKLSGSACSKQMREIDDEHARDASTREPQDGNYMKTHSDSLQPFSTACDHSLSKILEIDCTMKTPTVAAEVEYDENGQTWGVYGAEIDPEILGNAIQLHLQRLIDQNLNATEQSVNYRQEKQREPSKTKCDLKTQKQSCFVSRLFCFLGKNA